MVRGGHAHDWKAQCLELDGKHGWKSLPDIHSRANNLPAGWCVLPSSLPWSLFRQMIDNHRSHHVWKIEGGYVTGSLRKGSFNGMVARTLPKIAPRTWKSMRYLPLPTFPCMTLSTAGRRFSSNDWSSGGTDPSADGVVIVTPEYNYSVPGGLKMPSTGFPACRINRWPVNRCYSDQLNGRDWRRALSVSPAPILVFLDAMVMNKPEFMGGVIRTKLIRKPEKWLIRVRWTTYRAINRIWWVYSAS